MHQQYLNIYQKALGLFSTLFFAYFAFSVGDDAIQSGYSGVGFKLKILLLLTLVAAGCGVGLLFSKKPMSRVTLISHTIVLLVGLAVFFSASAWS